MEPFGTKATVLATSVAVLASWRGYRKQSLTPTGAMAAFSVGFGSVITGSRGFNLLVFYQVATTATKYKKDLKAKLDGTVAKTGSQARGPIQVLACSAISVTLGLIHAVYCGRDAPIVFDNSNNNAGTTGTTSITMTMTMMASNLACANIAHHATCLGDSLASELGILAKSSPVLITQPWKKVPSGTNGGVTAIGFFWSAMGGCIIGLSTIALDAISGLSPLQPIPTILFATVCGLLGSVIDSILGATVQETYYDPDTKLVYQHEDDKPPSSKLVAGFNLLTNEQVNIVSVAITTFLGGWVLGPLFF